MLLHVACTLNAAVGGGGGVDGGDGDDGDDMAAAGNKSGRRLAKCSCSKPILN